MHIAIIGCGYIADHYVQSTRGYPSLQIAGVFDRDARRAERFGAFHGLPVYGSREELLADRRVQVVLNLTNPRSHYEVSRACLEAGKHVYSEKPLATEFDRARELVDFAGSRGLRISGAPCNVLGETAQTLWKALRENAVGRVRLVYAEMDDGPVHRMPFHLWNSASGAPWPYRDEFEIGCTLEHAGYTLGLLAACFGPAKSVSAFASTQIPDKHPDVPRTNVAPDFTVATVVYGAGVVARLTCSVVAPDDHALRIFGDDGVLSTPDVWRYDAPVYSQRWVTLRRKTFLTPWKFRHGPLAAPGRKAVHDDRARGVAELVAAIEERRPSRLSPQFCLHVTELTLAIQNAGTMGGTYYPATTFEPPEPMPWAAGGAPAERSRKHGEVRGDFFGT